MAQNLTINGVTYNDVSSLSVPLAAGGNATFPDTSDATAVAADMLSGKTAYVNGALVTGTIASKATATYTPGTSNQTIAAGQYLSGVQTISGDSDLTAANVKKGVGIFGVTGTYTSDATATAANILSGKTAYVNGSKLTGTIASKAAATYTPTTTDQSIALGQYLSGAQTVKGDANLVAANIASGVSIFGVTGSFSSGTPNLQSKSVNYTSNGSATVTPDSGYDGLSQVDVTVNVSGGGGGVETSELTIILDAYYAYDDMLCFMDINGNYHSVSSGTFTVPRNAIISCPYPMDDNHAFQLTNITTLVARAWIYRGGVYKPNAAACTIRIYWDKDGG